MNSNPVNVSLDQDIAVISIDSPPVNTISAAVRRGLFEALKCRDIFGPMHWQPSPLLARLADEGRSLADWDAARQGRSGR